MFLLFTLLHLALLLCLGMVWLRDTRGRILFTPFFVFAALDVLFSWNYWLLFLDVDVDVTPHALIVSMLATTSFLMGCIFLSAYAATWSTGGGTACRLKQYLAKPFIKRSPAISSLVLVCLLAIGIGAGFAYHRRTPPTIEGAMVLLEEGDLQEARSIVKTGRIQVTKSHVFGGSYHGEGIFKGFMMTAWTYGLTLSLLLAFTDRRARWKFFVLLFLFGTYYFVAGTGERRNFLAAIVVVMTGLSFVVHIGFKKAAGAGAMLLLLMALLTFLLPRYQIKNTGGEQVYEIFRSIAVRIFMGSKINNVRLMNFLEKGTLEHSFGEAHLNAFLNALPGIHRPPLSAQLGAMIGANKTTYASGSYQGKVYLDFGSIGIAIIYFGLGVFVALVFHFLLSFPKRLENIALMALLIFRLGHMSMAGGLITFFSTAVPIVSIHLLVLALTLLMSPLQPSRAFSALIDRGSRVPA